MKNFVAVVLSLMAFLAPLAALAAAAAGNGLQDPPPEESKGGAGESKYGSFALDANGNKVSGEALSKLPPEAKWAMEAKGLSPVLGPNGEVLGYDDGRMAYLPDAIGKDYAAAAERAKLGPDVQGPCPPSFPDCRSPEAVQPPPPTEAAAEVLANVSPGPGKNHCDQPGPPPPCAPRKETPEQIAEREKQEAERKNNAAIAAATQSKDVDALAAAFDERNKARADADKTAGRDGAPGGALGVEGTDAASTGPGPAPVGSGGGQNLGPEGRVGGGLAGREVTPDSRALAQSIIDMNAGMANGNLGPGDPDALSVAQAADRGLRGRAVDAAKKLFTALGESLGVAAANPEADLSDQLATSPIDGARRNQNPIRVRECESGRHETLGTKGRNIRKAGGC